MMRLGLCCKFSQEPIRFRTITAKYLSGFSRPWQLQKLSDLCIENALSLSSAIRYCAQNNIGCFRVNSRFFPLATHPDFGYAIKDLPDRHRLLLILNTCHKEAESCNVRLSFHPDQFVLLSSQDDVLVQRSLRELEYQAEVSRLIGADVINIHAGGAYGDKALTLQRMDKVIKKLSRHLRSLLTLENDDRIYTPVDLIPFCNVHGIPFVYDVHHHRCLPDTLTIPEATRLALKTWNREPLFHISSPKYGWKNKRLRWHHDSIDIRDFPREWISLNITVEVEAKAKELAVKKLYQELSKKKKSLFVEASRMLKS